MKVIYKVVAVGKDNSFSILENVDFGIAKSFFYASVDCLCKGDEWLASFDSIIVEEVHPDYANLVLYCCIRSIRERLK